MVIAVVKQTFIKVTLMATVQAVCIQRLYDTGGFRLDVE